MSSTVRPLTRDKLAAVFKTPEVIRAFEAMVTDVGVTLPAAVQSATDAAAAAVLAAGDALSATVSLDVRVDVLEAAAASSGHTIEDEGVALTQRTSLNFVGPGVTAADSGGKTVVTIPGAVWTEAEVDFGAAPVYSASFAITDAAISAASKVQVLPCGKAATGRTADDWAWDGATFAADPGAGSATCYATFIPGPIVGRRRIQYSVGA